MKSKILLMILVGAMLLPSCGRKPKDPVPEGILPDSVMVSVLTDIFIIEGVMVQLEYLQRRPQDAGVPYYRELFLKHGVTRDQFAKSLDYYTRDPERLDKVYDKVIQNLSRHQLELREEGEKRDSAGP